MSLDLGDTWHQGLPWNPQWEGGLEVGSDSDAEDVAESECENDEDKAAAGEARDEISEVRESSRWAPLCHYRSMCRRCVRFGQSGTMRNCVVNLQYFGSSS